VTVTEIYMFASMVTEGLFAFSGSPEGHRLPAKDGPWKRTRTIRAEEALPHRMDRTITELAINTHGCQLWRFKSKPRPGHSIAPAASADDSEHEAAAASETARRQRVKS
jgi:hypothetical protein